MDCFILLSAIALCCPIGILLLFLWLQKVRQESCKLYPDKKPTLGFFHPYCNAGGGGERVLWAAIRAIQERYPNYHCIVYTGDKDVTPEEIVTNAEKRFNIKLTQPVRFVYLQKRHIVEAKYYPVFTLLGQSIGSVFLGLEAILKFVPTIYIDTMGYAFTCPLFKYLGLCHIISYVHYPTISNDMLSRVSEQIKAHNNRAVISRSPFLTSVKLLYYRFFAYLYGLCGRCSSIIMVNSSWTMGHIVELWKVPVRTFLVYPPCDVTEFTKITRDPSKLTEEFRVLSVAQFRPEKDHDLQLRVFAELKDRLPPEDFSRMKLVLVGSCRNEADTQRVEALKRMTEGLGIGDRVEFKLNITFAELKKEMEQASVGIHTMWNEHFGIGVVECMAAGLLMVAHDSGGPKMDIVTPFNGKVTGFLASDVHSYADVLQKLLRMPPGEALEIQTNGRKASRRFSDEVFSKSFLDVLEVILRIKAS
ncbi:GDP-Man:Man(3)GlcNAc(2)-PP-Dol alpha-1,2-mannosyltransferase-like [Ornithodoros turicata]|uniref:GDP-Man:Man(3)GlcNAc(2)-PP-Dol alpha-1,2-mannosyltransferase-like n=1 Tax=Ornithodoros turicata TaxID=34597 RepID=UPI00313A1484